jgi:hypothetical protein
MWGPGSCRTVHGVPAPLSLRDFGHAEVFCPFSNTTAAAAAAAAVAAAAAAAEIARSSQLSSSFAGQAVQYVMAGGRASPS